MPFGNEELKRTRKQPFAIALNIATLTGRVDNFKKSGGADAPAVILEPISPFDDSDVFKIMEGMAYSINMLPNKELEEQWTP